MHKKDKLKNIFLLIAALLAFIVLPVLHPLFHAGTCGEAAQHQGYVIDQEEHETHFAAEASCPICSSFFCNQHSLLSCDKPVCFHAEVGASGLEYADSHIFTLCLSHTARAPPATC